MQRIAFDDEHHMYRDTVRRFIAQEIVPNDQEWEDAGAVDRDLFRKAAAQGLLAMQVPEEHGGLGLDDFRFNQIVGEEVGVAGVIGSGTGITLHTDVVLPYILELATDGGAELLDAVGVREDRELLDEDLGEIGRAS